MINVLSRSAAVVLLFSNAMSSYAASVESEVSDTDTVVIGAISEKVTVRVMGYKNLNGSEKNMVMYMSVHRVPLVNWQSLLAPKMNLQ